MGNLECAFYQILLFFQTHNIMISSLFVHGFTLYMWSDIRATSLVENGLWQL